MQQDPHEIAPRIASFQKDSFMETWTASLNACLAHADLPDVSGCDPTDIPLVYIVGVPRSGTTLLSQVLSFCLDVGYINNLVARFWERPSVGVLLSKALLPETALRHLDFTSDLGATQGVVGPHEFGYFWRKWFALDTAPTHHLTADMQANLDARGLQNALENEILRPFGKPTVFKNVICGFHARYLSNIHKKSIFIYVKRSDYEVACSLLQIRVRRYGSYEAWCSLQPSTYPFQEAGPAEEVARQVQDCCREMEAELSAEGLTVLHVDYNALCADPDAVVRRVQRALADMGHTVEVRQELGQPFDKSPAAAIPKALDARLCAVLRRGSKM